MQIQPLGQINFIHVNGQPRPIFLKIKFIWVWVFLLCSSSYLVSSLHILWYFCPHRNFVCQRNITIQNFQGDCDTFLVIPSHFKLLKPLCWNFARVKEAWKYSFHFVLHAIESRNLLIRTVNVILTTVQTETTDWTRKRLSPRLQIFSGYI